MSGFGQVRHSKKCVPIVLHFIYLDPHPRGGLHSVSTCHYDIPTSTTGGGLFCDSLVARGVFGTSSVSFWVSHRAGSIFAHARLNQSKARTARHRGPYRCENVWTLCAATIVGGFMQKLTSHAHSNTHLIM